MYASLQSSIISILARMSFLICLISILLVLVDCHSKDKPHGHQGVLEVFNGKLIPFTINAEQQIRLDKGEPVSI